MRVPLFELVGVALGVPLLEAVRDVVGDTDGVGTHAPTGPVAIAFRRAASSTRRRPCASVATHVGVLNFPLMPDAPTVPAATRVVPFVKTIRTT